MLQCVIVLLTGTLCQPPGYLALAALLEEDLGIDPSQVEDVIEYSYWPSTSSAFHRVWPCNLIQDVHIALGVVKVSQ